MAKRVTFHSGRVKGSKHNFREFDISKSDHIDAKRTVNNLNYNLYKQDEIIPMPQGVMIPEKTICSDAYTELYNAGLEALNGRYRASGHKERCKTMEHLLTSSKTRPNEIILQVGKIFDTIRPELFCRAVENYIVNVNDYCRQNGVKHEFLSCSIHLDESTPHAHIKETYAAYTKDGNLMPLQEECFRQAGMSLPDPEQPEGRYNNRKITFDQKRREIWQETCKNLGIEIETNPGISTKELKKKDFIQRKILAWTKQQLPQIMGMIENARQQMADAGVLDLSYKYLEVLKVQDKSTYDEIMRNGIQGVDDTFREVVSNINEVMDGIDISDDE